MGRPRQNVFNPEKKLPHKLMVWSGPCARNYGINDPVQVLVGKACTSSRIRGIGGVHLVIPFLLGPDPVLAQTRAG